MFAMISETDEYKIRTSITRLSNVDILIRRNAAFSLAHLARNNPANQTTIQESKGIAAIIRSLNDTDNRTKQYAAMALWHLTDNTNNKYSIQIAQSIQPLIKLLNDINPITVQFATKVLLNLSIENSNNQDAIRHLGGIPPLVNLLNDSDVEIRLRSAQILSNLAKILHNSRAIRIAKGIPPLVALLNDANNEIITGASEALLALAINNPTNQVAIISCDALPRLNELANNVNVARKLLTILGEKHETDITQDKSKNSDISSCGMLTNAIETYRANDPTASDEPGILGTIQSPLNNDHNLATQNSQIEIVTNFSLVDVEDTVKEPVKINDINDEKYPSFALSGCLLA